MKWDTFYYKLDSCVLLRRYHTIQEIAYQQQQDNLKREYVQLHNNLGVSYLYDGKVEAAKDEFNKTLKLDSLNKNATMYLFECDVFSKASVYDVNYDPDILYKQLNELKKANPNDPVLYLYLGDFYNNYGDTGNALNSYQQATDLDSSVSDAYEKIGYIYVKKMQYDQALANLSIACNLSPWNLLYQDNIADAYYIKKDYQNATDWYNKTLYLDKYHLISYLGLAHCYRQQGKIEDALENQKMLILYSQGDEKANLSINKYTWSFSNIDLSSTQSIKYYIYYDIAMTYYLLENETQAIEYVNKTKLLQIDNKTKSSIRTLLYSQAMYIQKTQPKYVNQSIKFQNMLNSSY